MQSNLTDGLTYEGAVHETQHPVIFNEKVHIKRLVVKMVLYTIYLEKEIVQNYYASVGVTVAAMGAARFCGCLGLLRPHLTVIRSPSTSSPLAHA
jgi:hypothetical protein